MTLIKLYEIKKNTQKFIMFSGLFLFVSGVIFLIYFLINGFDTRFPGGDWVSVIITFQGILFFAMGYSQLKNERYFIEWTPAQLRYFLPKDKEIQSIDLSVILDLKIKNNLVTIITNDEKERTIKLMDIQFHTLKRIKEKFEEIKPTK